MAEDSPAEPFYSATKKYPPLCREHRPGWSPRIGNVIAEEVSDTEAVTLVQRCLKYYQDNVEKIGIEALKKAVL
jgi:hypothetical protein